MTDKNEIDEFNKLSVYDVKDGIVTVNQGDTLKMKFVVKDYNNNVSILPFTLIGVESPEIEQNNILTNLSYSIFDGKSCDINLNGFEAHIPKNAFYRDVTLSVSKIDT